MQQCLAYMCDGDAESYPLIDNAEKVGKTLQSL